MSSYASELRQTAQAMMAPGKGILAMDESNGTCNKRFDKLGIPTTEDRRRAYRQLILTTSNLSEAISGAILYDETIRQSTDSGVPLTQVMKDGGIIIGIKVDTGAKDLAGHEGEKVTEGLDGLRDRIAEYYQMGARFAKWRSVITIKDGLPSRACIEANAHGLARYAALCQEGGLVPIVEPEVLINGDHTLERCYEVTDETLHTVFEQLYRQGVAFDQMILKPSMVISGLDCPTQSTVEQVADATVACLLKNVPAMVPGVAFLSGGQSEARASEHLNMMNQKYGDKCPWRLTFSYARAIQQPALNHWRGDDSKVAAAQKLLLHRARCNGAASQGQYNPDMEKQPALV
ncbi:putative fructose-bisphosphate aldolase class 1 [Halomicronema hongdechloris C2206]|uniref:Probable fructose-bisphosphate aldolase class 1 n=1 Tax=Halomicronema hongdechloris C2206 TaxID=1641165 RepID=A0A1Z3HH60_9CYAN|nr:class I fructose-bisphosphate aldolase [Halomicronema hongdechloris]ASC69610.1 putative fructose-bisphosphate aldolase class 1 [Halomicronema hongdechloris C2206]